MKKLRKIFFLDWRKTILNIESDLSNCFKDPLPIILKKFKSFVVFRGPEIKLLIK